MNRSEREVLWLRKIRDVSREIAQEHDLDRLLPQILDAAIAITDAERGYLVRVQRPDGQLKVHVEVARGFNRGQLESNASSVSRTVVERVIETGEPLVTTREEDAGVLDVSSVIQRRVLAICCVPLRLRGETAGVLYLDHRLVPNAFNVEDLPIIAVFADQAALAIETAELRANSARLNDNLRELLELQESVKQTPPSPLVRHVYGRLTGGSQAMCGLYSAIERVARSRDPVLIFGESGTGKQLVARELHARGELPQQPFLEQVCAAAAEPDLERALFGEKGRVGALLAAERGTLLLVEIADLPPALQARLAGVLRERAVQPPAGGRPVRLSCRVVATSTRDLREEVEAGRFREDLYYRLDVQRLELPPLRKRRDDLPLLLDHFARVHGNRTLVFTDNARGLLARYAWPGNVRELENEVRRLVTLDVERISARQLSPEIREGRGVSTAKGALSGRTLQEVEKEMIEAALADAKGNKAKAARQLGVPRSSLYGLMQRHGLE